MSDQPVLLQSALRFVASAFARVAASRRGDPLAAVPRQRPAGRATIEPLEPLRLMSVTLSGTKLTVIGSDGNDHIWASAENNSIIISVNGTQSRYHRFDVAHVDFFGGRGNDLIEVDSSAPITCDLNGEAGNDSLHGGGREDIIRGGTGDDHLDNSGDGDHFFGGEGFDTVDYRNNDIGVYADIDGASHDDGAPGEGDTIELDVEGLVGSPFADVLIGSSGKNSLRGGGGNDWLAGLGGNDWFDGGTGADEVYGGLGRDTMSYATRSEPIIATLESFYGGASGGASDGRSGYRDSVAGDVECLEGGRGADRLTGNGANNGLWGNGGNDTLMGRGGDDILLGGDGADVMYGESGNDSIYGGRGNDTLVGGNGNDVLNGEDDDDSLYGEAGDDILYFRTGFDYLNGGTGKTTYR